MAPGQLPCHRDNAVPVLRGTGGVCRWTALPLSRETAGAEDLDLSCPIHPFVFLGDSHSEGLESCGTGSWCTKVRQFLNIMHVTKWQNQDLTIRPET